MLVCIDVLKDNSRFHLDLNLDPLKDCFSISNNNNNNNVNFIILIFDLNKVSYRKQSLYSDTTHFDFQKSVLNNTSN